MVVSLDIHTDC